MNESRHNQKQQQAGRRLLVMLCTYNERANIEQLVPEIHKFAPQADIIIIDDNSPDGTGDLADSLAKADGRIHALHRAGKLGLGTAQIAGMQYAMQHNYDLLINLDADFSHHPRHIPALLDCSRRVEVAIGSRYMPGGGVEGWGIWRHVMSRLINGYARLLLRLKTRDNSGSYRCYHVARLRRIDFSHFRATGYAFLEELLYRCRRVGCRFEETPIFFADRRFGSSKINLREAVTAVWVIFLLAIDNLRGVRVEIHESDTEVRGTQDNVPQGAGRAVDLGDRSTPADDGDANSSGDELTQHGLSRDAVQTQSQAESDVDS